MNSNPPAAPNAWVFEFILLAAIWGASFLCMRLGAVEFGPLPTAGLRIGIAALFLLPIALARGHAADLRRHWRLTLVTGIFNSAIPFACYGYALLSVSTGMASILNATVPLFGATVAWLWLKDTPGPSRVAGLLIGFAGVALLAWDKIGFKSGANADNQGGATVAVLACLLACLCYGLAASFTRRYMAGLSSLVSATGSQISAAIALAPLTWWYWPQHPVSPTAWLAILALGVLCTGVAYVLYFRLIERAGPARALSVTFAIPVFAVFYGVVLLDEVVTPWMLGCAAIIIAGTALSSGLVRLQGR